MSIILVTILALLIVMLLLLIEKRPNYTEVGMHELTSVVISPGINLDEIAQLSEKEFTVRLANLMVDYYKNNVSRETIVELYHRRSRFLIGKNQKATLDVATANSKLISRLEVLENFLESTNSQLMTVSNSLNRRKRRRFKRKIKPIANFLDVIRQSGESDIARIFYFIPTGEVDDDDDLESPFNSCYNAVFSCTELNRILSKLSFDFEKFEMLMSEVACAKIEYTNIFRIRTEVHDELANFFKFREESVELKAILHDEF